MYNVGIIISKLSKLLYPRDLEDKPNLSLQEQTPGSMTKELPAFILN